MSKLSLQNQIIIREMNSLIIQLAYDGRSSIKIRFRKAEDSNNCYLIEAFCKSSKLSSVVLLENNPFNVSWSFSIRQIKKAISLPYCRKSRYGGYTFYH